MMNIQLDSSKQKRITQLLTDLNNSGELDLDRLSDFVMEQMLHIFSADAASIMMYNRRLGRLEMLRTLCHDPKARQQQYAHTLFANADGQHPLGITDWVYQNNAPARVDNVHTDLYWRDHYYPSDPNTLSELDVPLVGNNQLIGVLGLESHFENHFSEEDQVLLSALAGTLAMRIQIARAYREQERLIAGYLHISEITQMLFQAHGQDELLHSTIKRAMMLTETENGNLLLYSEQEGVLFLRVSYGAPLSPDYYQSVDENDGVVGYCAARRELVNVSDINQPPTKYRIWIKNMRSELAVPVIDGDRLLGVLNLESPEPNHFDEIHEQLMRVLADQVAAALRHIEQETQMELDQVRSMAMNHLEHLTIAAGDSDDVMKIILQYQLELTQSDVATLHIVSNNEELCVYDMHVDEDAQYHVRLRNNLRPRSTMGQGIVDHVIRTRQPYVTNDAQNDTYFWGDSQINSNLAVPAINEKDGELLCVLNVETYRRGAYTPEHANLLERLAIFAVLAINRGRDFRRIHLANEASEALAKLSTIEDIRQAYAIVLDIAEKNSQGVQTVIRRLESNRFLIPVAVARYEYPPRTMLVDEYPNHFICAERQTIIIPDVKVPEREEGLKRSNPHIKALMMTPIVSDGRLYGTITLGQTRTNSFNKADKELVEVLASQLGQTIHRLNETQTRQGLEVFSTIGPRIANRSHALKNLLLAVGLYVKLLDVPTLIAQAERDESKENYRLLRATIDEGYAKAKEMEEMFQSWGQYNQEVISIDTLFARFHNSRYFDEHITLQVQPCAPGADRLLIDESDIIACLENMIDNATRIMRQTERGSFVRLSTRLGHDLLQPEITYVEILVEDDGPGIEPYLINRLFNPQIKSTKFGVTGMGLFFAQLFVKRNHGEIWAENRAEGGALFCLRFPTLPNLENG